MKCPECGSPIFALSNVVIGKVESKVTYNRRHNCLEYQLVKTHVDSKDEGEFYCPCCTTTLFTTKHEAEQFFLQERKPPA